MHSPLLKTAMRTLHAPSLATWLHRSLSSSSSFIMFPCSSFVELLCRLIKSLDAVAVVESPEASSSTLQARLKEIKCQLERLQLKLIKEMYCKEDNAMEQLRHLAGCLDELAATAGQDSQCGFWTLKSLEKVEAAVYKALNLVADRDLYMQLCGKENERKEGPWGPRLGFDWDIGAFHNIKTINVSADDRINSIQIEYNFNCRKYKTPRIGGEGGTLHQIELVENEHITSIRGTYDTISLTKLEIVTNKISYSFGKGCGGSVFPPRQLSCDCKVVGFFGRAASYVNAIGIYFEKTLDDDSPNKRRSACLCQSGTMSISHSPNCHVCS